MIKTPASPQDEPPILNTDEGSDDKIQLRSRVIDENVGDEVVLIAIMRPAKTIGRTKPEFHLMSYRVSLFRVTYNGDSITAETNASAIATGLCDE